MILSRLFRRNKSHTGNVKPRSHLTDTPSMTHADATNPSRSAEIPHEKIAQRAYELWCSRGKPSGSEREDWFAAIAQLRLEFQHVDDGSSPRKPR